MDLDGLGCLGNCIEGILLGLELALQLVDLGPQVLHRLVHVNWGMLGTTSHVVGVFLYRAPWSWFWGYSSKFLESGYSLFWGSESWLLEDLADSCFFFLSIRFRVWVKIVLQFFGYQSLKISSSSWRLSPASFL